MNVLETRALKKYYGEGETQVRALDGVDLTCLLYTSPSPRDTR